MRLIEKHGSDMMNKLLGLWVKDQASLDEEGDVWVYDRWLGHGVLFAFLRWAVRRLSMMEGMIFKPFRGVPLTKEQRHVVAQTIKRERDLIRRGYYRCDGKSPATVGREQAVVLRSRS